MAGLALAILPLLISTAEHYDECFRPFLRYKRFTKEANEFRQLLQTQKTIFRGQCSFLLEHILERDIASGMLNVSNHPLWSDPDLEARIVQALGEQKDTCIILVGMIREQLQEIEAESQKIGAIIDRDRVNISLGGQYTLQVANLRSSQSNAADSSLGAWRQRFTRKLRFSFSESRLEKLLTTLRERNAEFRTVSKYAIDSISKQTHALATNSHPSIKRIEKYQNIQKAARQVYEALGKACTKHAEHLALFCVEVEDTKQDVSCETQVRFNIAFTQPSADPTATEAKPLWFMVDSTVGDVALGQDIGSHEDFMALTKDLGGQFETQLGITCTTGRNGVTAALSSARGAHSPSALNRPLSMMTNSFLLDEKSERNLCDHLQRCLTQPLQDNVCLGILENADSCQNHVYPPPSTIRSRWPYATSLGKLVASTSLQQSMVRIPLIERLRLAKILAIAVLQYHATPWLRRSWRKEDVLFLGLDMNSPKFNIPSLANPCLNVKVRGPNETASRTSTFPLDNPIRNPLIFSLGVLLLEIAYSASLESLQRSNDITSRQNDPNYLEFYLARRISKSGCTGMGTIYDKIVEKLVECDFGCGSDLVNVDLQAAFHDHVIRPLEEMERGMASLLNGSPP